MIILQEDEDLTKGTFIPQLIIGACTLFVRRYGIACLGSRPPQVTVS